MKTTFPYMLKLDPHLKESLFRNLPRRDLKTLRLSSRALLTLVTPYIFDRLYISSHPLDLEVFNHICNAENIAQHVTHLIWDDSMISPRFANREFFRNELELQPATIDQEELDQEELHRDAWPFWHTFTQEHCRIRAERLDLQALMAALPKLSKLSSVTLTILDYSTNTISPDYSPEFQSPTFRQWSKLPFLSWLIPPEARWSTPAKIPLQKIPEMISMDYFEDGASIDPINSPEVPMSVELDLDTRQPDQPILRPVIAPYRGFIALTQALSSCPTTRIREFRIRPPTHLSCMDANEAGIDPWIFHEWTPELSAFASVVKNLRKLTLDFSVAAENDAVDFVHSATHLGEILRDATKLEDLQLHFGVLDANIVLSLDHEAVVFGHLSRLCLRDAVGLNGSLLLPWLIRHLRVNLRRIEIQDCQLDEHELGIQAILDGLRKEAEARPFASLEEFSIDGVSDGTGFLNAPLYDSPGEALKYIKGLRDETPRMETDFQTPPRRNS
jgi:hypothetical protein